MRVLLITICLVFFNSTFGQLKKDNWLMSGGGTFYAFRNESNILNSSYNSREINASFLSSVGNFVSDKFVIGFGNRLSVERIRIHGQELGIKNFRWSIGPFLRYYFLPAKKDFNFFTDVDYQLGFNSNFGRYKGKYNLISISPGIEVFLNSTVGIHVKMGYSRKVVSTFAESLESKIESNGLESSIGISLHLEK